MHLLSCYEWESYLSISDSAVVSRGRCISTPTCASYLQETKWNLTLVLQTTNCGRLRRVLEILNFLPRSNSRSLPQRERLYLDICICCMFYCNSKSDVSCNSAKILYDCLKNILRNSKFPS